MNRITEDENYSLKVSVGTEIRKLQYRQQLFVNLETECFNRDIHF